MHHEQLETEINLLHAADHRGRPIGILRIGGRIPVGRHRLGRFGPYRGGAAGRGSPTRDSSP